MSVDFPISFILSSDRIESCGHADINIVDRF